MAESSVIVSRISVCVAPGTSRTIRPSARKRMRSAIADARALVSRPTVLFADEPTGNLDSATGNEILALMRDSVDAYGQTTVMVTHEARAAAIADRILFLADGLIVRDLASATQAEILETMNELSAA